MGSAPLRNSKIVGDKLNWTIEVKKPTSVKLLRGHHRTELHDERLRQLSMFGKAEVKAERLQS